MARKKLTEVVLSKDKTIFIENSEIERKFHEEIMESLKKHDEIALRAAAIRLMESFLEGKVRLNFLSFIAEAFIHMLLMDEKNKDFAITEGLYKVYDELSILENEKEHVAKQNVKQLLKKLKNKTQPTKKMKFYEGWLCYF